MKAVSVIVTVPPYAAFIEDVAKHPSVSALRLNTVMPIKGEPRATLQRLMSFGRPLFVDLKGRQLRVVGGAVPPFTEVRLSHRIDVKTPCDAFFDDGREHARVVAVDGDRLILEDSPRRFVGPGESVNIPDPSLRVEGTLTETDRAYLRAMNELGMKDVMLSFVEARSDVDEVLSLLPGASVVAKIESRKGLEFSKSVGAEDVRVMAARGDLFVEVEAPHRILKALRTLIARHPTAIVGSRILTSLARHPVPTSSDLSDVAYLLGLGYRTLMLGDEVCLRRDSVKAALEVIEAVSADFAGS